MLYVGVYQVRFAKDKIHVNKKLINSLVENSVIYKKKTQFIEIIKWNIFYFYISTFLC